MIIKISIKTVVFLLVLTLITAVMFISGGIVKQFIMFYPLISAIFATAVTDKKWKSFGWNFSLKWILIAWAIPVLYSAIAYGFIWVTGLGEVPNPLFLERAKLTIGLETNTSSIIIITAFFYISLVMLIPSVIFCLGEEIGWRGLLFPELNKVFTFKKAAIYSSIIWALWHFPDLLFGDYGDSTTPLVFRLIAFFFMVIFSGVIISWLWIKSKSVWVAAVFHASHNGVVQMFFDRITLDLEYTKYFKGEFGIALVISTFLIMLLVFSFIKKDKDKEIFESVKKFS